MQTYRYLSKLCAFVPLRLSVLVPLCLFAFLPLCPCALGVVPGAALGAQKDIGLSVEPGWLLIRDVPVGQLYDADNVTKTLFKVHNGSDQSRHYSLKADKPEKVGVNVLKGYAGIPDPDWFWFETNEVATPANGAVEIKMFARIPDEEKYYNQKWAVGINVEGKPEAGEGLVLAVSPVFYIETEARSGVKEKPAGFLGLAPGTVVLENVAPGESKAVAKIKVFNNDSRRHRYRISSIVPSAEPGRQAIGLSPGFSWIPKKEWLKPDAGDLKIGSNKMKEIVLGLDIPAKTDLLNQRWEGIIFVESEEGSADFARVQIKNPGR